MNRIDVIFQQLKQQQRCALIPYITAGDPNPEITLQLMHDMVSVGADILELGVPFSDPMADGPIIQAAHERALKQKVDLNKIFEIVSEFRNTNTKTSVVLMGYLNPIEAYGYEAFANMAQQTGVDGVLVVDMPPEEAQDLTHLLKMREIAPIFLLAPTTTEQRVKLINQAAGGYLYYVSVKGITGAANVAFNEVEQRIHQIREWVDYPIAVGFGIRDAETARTVSQFADAVIVGSVLVDLIAQHADNKDALLKAVTENLQTLRKAVEPTLDATSFGAQRGISL